MGIIRQNRDDVIPELANAASCVNIETTPHRDPLGDLFNSGAICGTRLSPKNHATVEIAQAWVLSITVSIFKLLHVALTCAVEAPCAA